MHFDMLCNKLQQQLDNELPFVVYRKPEETTINALLQNNDKLYELNSYKDNSGFVFAPFDVINKTVLIPYKDSISYCSVLEVDTLKTYKKEGKQEYTFTADEKDKHISLVKEGVLAIKNSESLKKVVLSRKEEVTKVRKEPLQLFKELISNYPNAFVYCWYHPSIGLWLGATPEVLVKSKATTFTTMALAGTQLYQGTMHVQWGDKEREEHALVQYFIEKELSKYTDTISCSQVYTHKAGTLLHLKADISSVIDTSMYGINEVIDALHPTPAVCGLPKEQAKNFILNNERYDRKYYTGFLGELNSENTEMQASNLFVNLRCMELQENQKVTIYVGGGITKDSDPEKEWEETVRKTQTMKNVLN